MRVCVVTVKGGTKKKYPYIGLLKLGELKASQEKEKEKICLTVGYLGVSAAVEVCCSKRDQANSPVHQSVASF